MWGFVVRSGRGGSKEGEGMEGGVVEGGAMEGEGMSGVSLCEEIKREGQDPMAVDGSAVKLHLNNIYG